MSRFRKSKGRNIMKVTAYGLALALSIGSMQGFGTYALFTDTEDVASNLAISTGDIDVKVSQNQTITSIGQELEFSITNEGTLNQNISLNIQAQEQLSKHLNNIFIYFDPDTSPNISEIRNIKLNNYNMLQKSSGDLFTLYPGQTIDGYINLEINESINNNENYSLNLNVKATQIGKLQSDGFYDEEIQENIININNNDSIILEDYNGGLEYQKDKNRIDINYNVTGSVKGLIEAIDQLDGSLKANEGSIISVYGSGAFINSTCKEGTSLLGRKEIQIHNIDINSIKYSYGKGNYINIKFQYKDGLTKFYRVDFKKDRILFVIDSIEAKVTMISEQEFNDGNSLNLSIVQYIENTDESSKENIKKIESELVEQPKVEEEVFPSEPEVVYPPNEEIEEQSKSEVVESPKIEEEVLPIQPDVLEQQTEEIQGVLPNNTDTILERKEETDIEE